MTCLIVAENVKIKRPGRKISASCIISDIGRFMASYACCHEKDLSRRGIEPGVCKEK